MMKAASKKDKPSFYYHELKTLWLKTNEVKQSTTQRVKEASEKTWKGIIIRSVKASPESFP